MGNAILIALCLAIGINLLLFIVAYSFKSDKLTDISYAISFLAIDFLGLINASKLTVFSWLLFILPAIWSLRIGGFLLLRILRVGKDRRFDDKRQSFIKFGTFWLGQALTAWVVMLPVVIAQKHGGSMIILSILGVIVWSIGLLCEAVADFQKLRFKEKKVHTNPWIDSGLWKYSRHPNYFGEILVWVGTYVYCFTALGGAGKLIGLSSPLLIALLLRYVTGVPILEKSADLRWGTIPAYISYKKHSRLIVPLPRG